MEPLVHLRLAVYAPLTTPFPPFTTAKKPPHLKPNAVSSSNGVSGNFSASKWANRLFSDFQFLPTTTESPDLNDTVLTPPYPPPHSGRHVSIPINFYRVLGAKPHLVGDGINRCYEARVSKPPQYGYSDDALISRSQILQAACETLANPSLRREYDEGVADDEFDTIVTDVPWDNVRL